MLPTRWADLDDLSPLADIDHPIIRKAAESFSDEPSDDTHEGRIKSVQRHTFLEVKVGQWRGAVWIDPADGSCWLVGAGLAKGGHKDKDDFYEVAKRLDATGAIDDWLPNQVDQLQKRRERAAAVLADWELELQRAVERALGDVAVGGDVRIAVPHPIAGEEDVATVAITVARQPADDYPFDEIVVEFEYAPKHRGSDLAWAATTRLLIAINPPETAWDRYGDTFSTIEEPGRIVTRLTELRSANERGELLSSIENGHAHYTHRRNLTAATVHGQAVRSMCGVYFVPSHDHSALPTCPTCETRFAQLPL